MAGLIEVFLIVFLVFAGSTVMLTAIQRLAKKPLPVGCTPVDGECCQQPGSEHVCARVQQRRSNVEVHDAGA